MRAIFPQLHRHTDPPRSDVSHVYVLEQGGKALLIEAGNGSVFGRMPSLGIRQVEAVLLTHLHPDSAQGIAEATRRGIPVWVPERELEWGNREGRWVRQPAPGGYEPGERVLRDYGSFRWGTLEIQVIPTPGHTRGSVSLLLEWAGKKLAFSGDLIAGAGQVWSLAATQWSYHGGEGLAGGILSLLDVQERGPDLLLPTHGEPMGPEAIPPTVERLWELIRLRRHNPRLRQLRTQPFEPLTPHLLKSRTGMANYYVLRSDSGKALLLDFGYDFLFGTPSIGPLASGTPGGPALPQRPWLYTIPALEKQYGIARIEAVIPTHYHDDHVAGINLLREQYGTQVWCAERFRDVLEHPYRYRLPCLWLEPIPVDRPLPLETPIRWEEYTLTLYPLPGHTHYAVAIFFQVDGQRVLVSGDQYGDGDGLGLNYVYPNLFHPSDYVHSAELFRRLRPDLVLGGHSDPVVPDAAYFDLLEQRGRALERLHLELMPQEARSGAEQPAGDLTERVLKPYCLPSKKQPSAPATKARGPKSRGRGRAKRGS